MPRTPAQVRAELAAVLPLDLVGPSPGHPLEQELLPQPPSRWYLTGFLVPYEASEDQKSDATSPEQIGIAPEGGGTDDDTAPDEASARRVHFPSSIGVSVLVPASVKTLEVTVTWGDYRVASAEGSEPPAEAASSPRAPREVWKRTPRLESLTIALKSGRQQPVDVPNSGGLRVIVSTRSVSGHTFEPELKGTRAISVFLVNYREPSADVRKDEGFVFQAGLRVDLGGPSPREALAHVTEPLWSKHAVGDSFIARPNLRGLNGRDWDEQVADLQYRDVYEFAVGHGIATKAHIENGVCRAVETTWVPTAQVEKVVPGEAEGVELGMEALGDAASPDTLATMLRPLVDTYGQWIVAQRKTDVGHPSRRNVTDELLRRADGVKDRIAAGIELLSKDMQVFEAFCLANRAMARQARRRDKDFDGKGRTPKWYPFQLAFLLLNLRGAAEPTHFDREIVDLLFFPTGGGKTEAYLGLAAFGLVLRRLRHPGLSSAGVTVLMRYTLRLLTLDQLGRAATLICALELERQANAERLGPWPFEIGLWVGQAATPNRIGRKGDNDRFSARARTIAFQNDDKKPSPIPLENCPWCDTKFTRNAFLLIGGGKPNNDHPTDLRVQCVSRHCEFSGGKGRSLPIIAVDEPIYRRLPCFLIATVDKFASLPWIGPTGALFGKVDRYDAEGFYGPADPGIGRPLESPLLPPELVIQDELHLISGPLGTMVGLYETVIDALGTRKIGDLNVRPKVIASTATVRRAEKQIRALFTRREVEVFPPPGPNLRDSYFARTVAAAEPEHTQDGTRNARMYLAVAAQGRSMKVLLLRVYLALMSAAQRAHEIEGGLKGAGDPADPYMTLVGYFSSLRELGGSRRIVEDEVRSRLAGYHRRLRVGDRASDFAARRIAYEVLELTSREPTSKVADTKRRLALDFTDREHVDVALATNMISVGLDIRRLGLMVVLGQPKTAAEYIQATSRVGRDDERPGLVVVLLNVHKPRDRSHYERFEAFHASFYRSVEATSVTPFAPRAVDRGLAAVTVALARHGRAELTAASSAVCIGRVRTKLDFVADTLCARAAAHDHDQDPATIEATRTRLRGRVGDLLDAWASIAHEQEEHGAGLQYQREEGGAPPLLYDPLDPELRKKSRTAQKFKAQRSLRDVEPNVNLFARSLDGADIDIEEVET
jgi:hypothetical protein